MKELQDGVDMEEAAPAAVAAAAEMVLSGMGEL